MHLENEYSPGEEERSNFTLLDILRVIGGLLLLNAIGSWYFTSSTTWGYKGKLLNINYIKHRLSGHDLNLTMEELALYNGSDPNLPIFLALNGSVYDVTSSRHIYGPGGSYSILPGKDCARVMVTGCFNKEDEFTYDLRGLDMEEAIQDISNWQKFFENHKKYWYVGTVQHEPLGEHVPAPCNHAKFPY